MTDPASEEPTGPIPPAEPTTPIPGPAPTAPIPPYVPPARPPAPYVPPPVNAPAWPAPTAYPPGYGVPPGWGGVRPGWPVVVQETNGLAIASLTMGIIGLVGSMCCILFVPLAPAAVITGWLGMKKADQSGGRVGGRGVALAGLITGGVGTALLVVFFAFFGIFLVGGLAAGA